MKKNIELISLINQPFSLAFDCSDAPEFLSAPLTQYDLIEGGSSVINLTARGNPSTIRYKWSVASGQSNQQKPFDSTRFTTDGPILNITKVKRSDAAIYTLHATNDQGTSETAIQINVNCKLNEFISH